MVYGNPYSKTANGAIMFRENLETMSVAIKNPFGDTNHEEFKRVLDYFEICDELDWIFGNIMCGKRVDCISTFQSQNGKFSYTVKEMTSVVASKTSIFITFLCDSVAEFLIEVDAIRSNYNSSVPIRTITSIVVTTYSKDVRFGVFPLDWEATITRPRIPVLNAYWEKTV